MQNYLKWKVGSVLHGDFSHHLRKSISTQLFNLRLAHIRGKALDLFAEKAI